MVLFLDKKEQVIEFQLTNYGKHLFSQGKLDPKFYSFYDDDILYDSNYQTGTIDGSVTSPIFSEQVTHRLSLSVTLCSINERNIQCHIHIGN